MKPCIRMTRHEKESNIYIYIYENKLHIILKVLHVTAISVVYDKDL